MQSQGPSHKGILAIDFDGTIADTDFPEIKRIKMYAVEAIAALRAMGWFVIIYTCREGQHALDAQKVMSQSNLRYDLFNQNHPELTCLFKYDCRKVSADIYIDDKSLDMIGKYIDWSEIFVKVCGLEGQFEPMLNKCNVAVKED